MTWTPDSGAYPNKLECHKTKVVTLANHKLHWQAIIEPMNTQYRTKTAGKRALIKSAL